MIPPFPRIPHLPGSHAAADDLILDDEGVAHLFTSDLRVVEKLDGINVAVALLNKRVVIDVKPQWRKVLGGDVGRALGIYLRQREEGLRRLLEKGGVLYGEWLWHTVSMRHHGLPDTFVGFALRDGRGRMLPIDEARGRIEDAGFTASLMFWSGKLTSVRQVKELVRRRARQAGRDVEGVILEEATPRNVRYAKWVEPAYQHMRPGTLRGGWNLLGDDARRPVVWLPTRK
ncbi:MAG: RNA ligase family protein [Myxococcota bacterium]